MLTFCLSFDYLPVDIHLGCADCLAATTAINTSILLPVYSLDSKLILISKVFSNWNPPPPKSDKLFLTQQSFIFYG